MIDSCSNAQLKERVRAFWQEHPCGTKFADAPEGSRRFFELVEQHRYQKEWHIPAGADYTGVDLTDAAVELARKRFELFGLPGKFRTADAEQLDFPDETFDVVF